MPEGRGKSTSPPHKNPCGNEADIDMDAPSRVTVHYDDASSAATATYDLRARLVRSPSAPGPGLRVAR